MATDPLDQEVLHLAVVAFGQLIEEAAEIARRTYDTGDRDRSAACIRLHLGALDCLDLVDADRYVCPRCGHLLKLRPSIR